MTVQNKRTYLVVAAAVVAAIGAPTMAVEAPATESWGGFCNPAGTWIVSGDTGSVSLVTVAPSGFGEYTGIGETVAFDPSFGGALPAVDATAGRSMLHRTGQRAFDLGGLRYGWSAELAVVWIERTELVFDLDSGCKAGDVDGLYHYYAAWQDPFGDDPPLYGTFPGHLEAIRLPRP